MLLCWMVDWLCSCGCDDTHRIYLETAEEAEALISDLQTRGRASAIHIWRIRLPRRKASVVAALNDAAGVDVEDHHGAERELVAKLVRSDPLETVPAGQMVH